jgi:hypothetical protein
VKDKVPRDLDGWIKAHGGSLRLKNVEGVGNCGPRAICDILFGGEEHHYRIRLFNVHMSIFDDNNNPFLERDRARPNRVSPSLAGPSSSSSSSSSFSSGSSFSRETLNAQTLRQSFDNVDFSRIVKCLRINITILSCNMTAPPLLPDETPHPFPPPKELMEYRFLTDEEQPLASLFIYHTYWLGEDGVQHGHFQPLIPSRDYLKHIPNVATVFRTDINRWVIDPVPFLITAQKNIFFLSYQHNIPLPYHLLKSATDDHVYSTEEGYDPTKCRRANHFYHSPLPLHPLDILPDYALDKYIPSDFLPVSSPRSVPEEPHDGDYIDLHLNSLGNPNFSFALDNSDGFNQVANTDYYKMFLLHLPRHNVTRRTRDQASPPPPEAQAGLNSLLRAACISLFHTDIIHAEMRLFSCNVFDLNLTTTNLKRL